MTAKKIAVVTGSNKGIGFAIVKGLCQRFDGEVYLTARDVGRGEEAVKKLKALGLKPLFHQLDIKDQKSINRFREHLAVEHGGIDVLVNNAGIKYKQKSESVIGQNREEKYEVLTNFVGSIFEDLGPRTLITQTRETIAVNYYGLQKVCEALFPLLRQNGRVVNISSSCGHLSKIPSLVLRNKLSDPTLTVEGLNDLMEKFISDTIAGNQKKEGWGESAYVVSKVGCSALTIIQQREFDRENPNRNISVNSVHPGFVDTDMSNHEGHLTIEEGADAPLYLSLDDHNLKGKYVWCDKKEVNWFAESL